MREVLKWYLNGRETTKENLIEKHKELSAVVDELWKSAHIDELKGDEFYESKKYAKYKKARKKLKEFEEKMWVLSIEFDEDKNNISLTINGLKKNPFGKDENAPYFRETSDYIECGYSWSGEGIYGNGRQPIWAHSALIKEWRKIEKERGLERIK